jgi:hypothetical protein
VKQKEQTLNNLKALNAEQEKDAQRARQRDELMKKVCFFLLLFRYEGYMDCTILLQLILSWLIVPCPRLS